MDRKLVISEGKVPFVSTLQGLRGLQCSWLISVQTPQRGFVRLHAGNYSLTEKAKPKIQIISVKELGERPTGKIWLSLVHDYSMQLFYP